jgi:hypothetical protein
MIHKWVYCIVLKYLNFLYRWNYSLAYHYESYIHDSFINPGDTLDDPKNDITHVDVPWAGVRPSKLAYALEPQNADSLSFNNVNAVDYLPMCKWGVDHTSQDNKKFLKDTQGCKLFTVC